MRHDAFGDITYDQDDQVWRGRCALPVFAAYGRPPCDTLPDEPDADFLQGLFPLTIWDYTGHGPSPQQVEGWHFLRQHEPAVCLAVMRALLESYGADRGWVERLKKYQDSRLFGGVVRWIIGQEFETPEDLKPAVRCT